MVIDILSSERTFPVYGGNEFTIVYFYQNV